MEQPEIENKSYDLPRAEGIYGLWLNVVLDAVKEVRKNGKRKRVAIQFLFDSDNGFVDWVAEKNGYTPEALRKKIHRLNKEGSTDVSNLRQARKLQETMPSRQRYPMEK